MQEEQESLRQSFNQKQEILVPLAEARTHAPQIDWATYQPVVPNQTGVQVLSHIPLETIIPYIHWTFFFTAWKLNGRFAELTQLHDCEGCRSSWLAGFTGAEREKAEEAIHLYQDAKELLAQLVEQRVDYCRAVYGFFPAYSEADTIWMDQVALPVLRQQVKREDNTYKSLADYVMPQSCGRTDYVGAFAVTGGAGAESLHASFEAEGDTYRAMLLQTLTDRLAEATAEYLHEQVRKQFWGYVPDEQLSLADLFRVKYQGIRPAVGYPSLPDQCLNFTLDRLLDFSQIGIGLTENGAMTPTAAVSGLYLAHPDSSYFMVGSIDQEQLQDYASRRQLPLEEVRRLLSRMVR